MRIFKYLMITFIAVVALVGFAAPTSRVDAAYTPTSYWNGDENYPLAYSKDTANRYVDLSSAKLVSQTKDEATGIVTAEVKYDVVMVNNGVKVSTFSYDNLVKVNDGNVIYIASPRKGVWYQIDDTSFNQPQYNASLIVAAHFKL